MGMHLVAKKTESDIRDCEAADSKDERESLIVRNKSINTPLIRVKTSFKTYHGFQRDRFNERIEDLRECMSRHSSSSYGLGITVHASFPVIADAFEGWSSTS